LVSQQGGVGGRNRKKGKNYQEAGEEEKDFLLICNGEKEIQISCSAGNLEKRDVHERKKERWEELGYGGKGEKTIPVFRKFCLLDYLGNFNGGGKKKIADRNVK